MQKRRANAGSAAIAYCVENYGAQKGMVFGEAWLPIWNLHFVLSRVPLQVVKIHAHVAVNILEHTGLGANTTGLGA